MIFKEHLELKGKHAFLGASKYQWINYDNETLDERYISSWAQAIGTHLHEYAEYSIRNRIRLNKSDRHAIQFWLSYHDIPDWAYNVNDILTNLAPYVNDAISYKMSPEVKLKYSDISYGTADAIMYYEKERYLRIHDLKTGITPAHWEQLLIYAAFFFLEYGKLLDIHPGDVTTELRIYQNGECNILKPKVDELVPYIDRIVTANKYIFKNYTE